MARNKKEQRAAANAAAKATEKTKVAAIDTAKSTARPVEVPVVEPAAKVPELKKEKLPKKRHVRPARIPTAAGPAPLARGTTIAARRMSAGISKGLGGLSGGKSSSSASLIARNQGGVAADTETSARSLRRRARRQTGES